MSWTLVGAAAVTDLVQCRQNLARLHRAVQEYRRVHHKLPDQLSELVPEQLPTIEALQCPEVERRLSLHHKTAQPMDSKAYLFEFERRPITNDVAQGLGITQRVWRQWQMGKVGGGVPMVRCPHHPLELALSFDGEVYETGPDWEGRFSPLVDKRELTIEALLADHLHLKLVRIPARLSATPSGLIDLTPHYNGALNGWVESDLETNLAGLPPGPVEIGDVAFDGRGVVQLGSRNYAMLHRPRAMSSIAVGIRCHSLAFLHGTIGVEAEGNVIGRYVAHFEDGSTESVPMAYGRQVLDWHANPSESSMPGELTRAWAVPKGRGPIAMNPVHLYTWRWINPRPDLLIREIDFVSAMTQSSPFLVAVTALNPIPKPTDQPVNERRPE